MEICFFRIPSKEHAMWKKRSQWRWIQPSQQILLRKEVVFALKQMSPFKSPRLDGFNLNFYQTYWHIVSNEIISVVLNLLKNDCFDDEINFKYIVLIPKKKNHMYASNYKPISLCNLIYKIVSKVLANILKHIFPTIISKN